MRVACGCMVIYLFRIWWSATEKQKDIGIMIIRTWNNFIRLKIPSLRNARGLRIMKFWGCKCRGFHYFVQFVVELCRLPSLCDIVCLQWAIFMITIRVDCVAKCWNINYLVFGLYLSLFFRNIMHPFEKYIFLSDGWSVFLVLIKWMCVRYDLWIFHR